jgi:hypothetical protein
MRAHTQGKQTFLRELKDKNKGQKNPLVEILKKKTSSGDGGFEACAAL